MGIIKIGRPKESLINWDLVSLGKKQDKVLAAELGVSSPAVRMQRIKRGIKAFPRWRDWNEIPLGKVPDTIIATQLGITAGSVGEQRNKRKIAPANPSCRTPENEAATYPEAVIDLYWHENSIEHKFQVRVGRYRADWLIFNNLIVEYAGLMNHSVLGEEYRARLIKKEKFFQSLGYYVLIIRPEELKSFKTGKIPEVFEKKYPKCVVCGDVVKRDRFRSREDRITCNMPKTCRNILIARMRNRDYSKMIGIGNPNWKGGQIKSRGYTYVKNVDHPRANNHGYVRRAYLVIEKSIGRFVLPGEVVSYKDGDSSNDSLENLELMSRKEFHKRNVRRYADSGRYKGCHNNQKRLCGRFVS